jgi:hypothetical protein
MKISEAVLALSSLMMVAMLAWSDASEKDDSDSGCNAPISSSPASFRGGEEAMAAASGRRGGVGFGASRQRQLRGVVTGSASRRHGELPARQPPKREGVERLASTPTRRVFECFLGPYPAKSGLPNGLGVSWCVLNGPGFYTPKPVRSPKKTLAPNEALVIGDEYLGGKCIWWDHWFHQNHLV